MTNPVTSLVASLVRSTHPREIVVATRNAGKLRELDRLVEGLTYRFRPLSDFPAAPEVEETGATFLENAVLKALSAWEHTGVWALADDSGLCVEQLGGGPGVRSARYGGVDGDHARNNERLLRELAAYEEPGQRRAYFQATLALIGPAFVLGPDSGPAALRPSFLPERAALHVFEGRAHGTILHAPRGKRGFGYDPLFLSDDAGRSFAEIPVEDKNPISHRGRAFAALRDFLGRLVSA